MLLSVFVTPALSTPSSATLLPLSLFFRLAIFLLTFSTSDLVDRDSASYLNTALGDTRVPRAYTFGLWGIFVWGLARAYIWTPGAVSVSNAPSIHEDSRGTAPSSGGITIGWVLADMIRILPDKLGFWGLHTKLEISGVFAELAFLGSGCIVGVLGDVWVRADGHWRRPISGILDWVLGVHCRSSEHISSRMLTFSGD
ncbi:hypothetical protein DFH07DRAFT_775514 [Mycena maculata]|uniref:Uncharacterized protein n=1 Tax=Mycena maculata TaxID=230809 RepID=A0AAD7N7L9_9AGAR|nr:hypothetical protein DFH07DRAFT_775514 [Mycena maculata]